MASRPALKIRSSLQRLGLIYRTLGVRTPPCGCGSGLNYLKVVAQHCHRVCSVRHRKGVSGAQDLDLTTVGRRAGQGGCLGKRLLFCFGGGGASSYRSGRCGGDKHEFFDFCLLTTAQSSTSEPVRPFPFPPTRPLLVRGMPDHDVTWSPPARPAIRSPWTRWSFSPFPLLEHPSCKDYP